MKKGKHTEEQIIGVLKQVEAGRTVKEVARELGISEATIYTWKSRFGGMDVSDAQKLKGLEDENRRLKHLVAAQRRPPGRGVPGCRHPALLSSRGLTLLTP